MITKRTFEAVASMLAEEFITSVQLHQQGHEDAAKTLNRAVRRMTNETARYFRSENSSFDWSRYENRVFGVDRVLAVWHGGSSYSSYDYQENLEWFDNLEAAKDAMRSRYDGSDWFRYVNEERSGWFQTPGVDRESYMDLYTYQYDGAELMDGGEPYARLVFGPRGGVNKVFC